MAACSLLHLVVKSFDPLIQEGHLDRSQTSHSAGVGSQESVKPVDVAAEILFLQSDVNNCVRDFLANAVKELGFPYDNFEVRVEVHGKLLVLSLALFTTYDVLLQLVQSELCVVLLPFLEDLVFVLFSEHLGHLDVLSLIHI